MSSEGDHLTQKYPSYGFCQLLYIEARSLSDEERRDSGMRKPGPRAAPPCRLGAPRFPGFSPRPHPHFQSRVLSFSRSCGVVRTHCLLRPSWSGRSGGQARNPGLRGGGGGEGMGCGGPTPPPPPRELLLASQLPPGGAVLWPAPTPTPRAWSLATTGDSRG